MSKTYRRTYIIDGVDMMPCLSNKLYKVHVIKDNMSRIKVYCLINRSVYYVKCFSPGVQE